MSASTKRTNDVSKVREFIRWAINKEFGTMTAYAEKEGVSVQFVSNVLAGNKPIPGWMYKRFKINHVVAEHWEVEVSA